MKTLNENNYMNEIINHAIDGMSNINEGTESADLHHHLFNQDYFIIGTYKAEQFLSNGPGVFEAINEIKEYEESNFGDSNTDSSSPEKLVNMFTYIKGEEILNECKTLQKVWNSKLTKANIKAITKELQKQLVSKPKQQDSYYMR